jgi:hypothetical protein
MSYIFKGASRLTISSARSNNPGYNQLHFHFECFVGALGDSGNVTEGWECHLCREVMDDEAFFTPVRPGPDAFPSVVCVYCFISPKVDYCEYCDSLWLVTDLSRDLLGQNLCSTCENRTGSITERMMKRHRKSEQKLEDKYNKILESIVGGNIFGT